MKLTPSTMTILTLTLFQTNKFFEDVFILLNNKKVNKPQHKTMKQKLQFTVSRQASASPRKNYQEIGQNTECRAGAGDGSFRGEGVGEGPCQSFTSLLQSLEWPCETKPAHCHVILAELKCGFHSNTGFKIYISLLKGPQTQSYLSSSQSQVGL